MGKADRRRRHARRAQRPAGLRPAGVRRAAASRSRSARSAACTTTPTPTCRRPSATRRSTSVEYSDGFGRLLQTRTQAEDVLLRRPGVRRRRAARRPGRSRRRRRRPRVAPGDPTTSSSAAGRSTTTRAGWSRSTSRSSPPAATTPRRPTPSSARRRRMFYDPRGQVDPHGQPRRLASSASSTACRPTSTDPDVFAPTPWETYTYDANDNAGRTHAVRRRRRTATTGTPRPASRSTRSAARSQPSPATDPTPTTDWFVTRVDLRHPGQPARGHRRARPRRVPATSTTWPSRRCAVDSIDAGRRDTVLDAGGQRRRGPRRQGRADAARLRRAATGRSGCGRATTPASRSRCAQRIGYGDGGDPDRPRRRGGRAHNLLGRRDRATTTRPGWSPSSAYDFKGNVAGDHAPGHRRRRRSSPSSTGRRRRLAVHRIPRRLAARRRPDASPSAPPSCSTPTVYRTTTSLRRPQPRQPRCAIRRTWTADARELRPALQPGRRAGARASSTTPSTSSASPTTPRASARSIAYGNGVMTRYAYDPRHVPPGPAAHRALHAADGADLPADRRRRSRTSATTTTWPATSWPIHDRTPGQRRSPNTAARRRTPLRPRRFTYDPLYRLLSATGRECDVPPRAAVGRPARAAPTSPAPAPTPRRYRYDAVGNLLQLQHHAPAAGSPATFALAPGSNRLAQRDQSARRPFDYAYDATAT